ncbi:MAG TPA: HupU protein, partial [Comamonadaceae bacterium]|nr:HupU protein [Comamonadaceae bacterium]
MSGPLNVLWLQSGGCGGCSMSLLCADTTDFQGHLRDAGIHLLWHPSLSLACGDELVTLLDAIVQGHTRLDALCIEGALLRGPQGTGRFHMLAGTGLPMIDWVRRLSTRARHVLAVGSCAAWGGITAGGDNPTDACGLQYDDDQPGGLLGAGFRSGSGLPVINVAGCPTHPGWVIDTLMALALGEFDAHALDPLNRPRFYADQLVH